MSRELQQAFQLYQQGNRTQAEQICRRVLAEHPRHPDALHLMGLLEKDRGSLEQARVHFQKGLKKNPRHIHLLNSMGLVEKQLGESAKAEAHFRQALEIDPGFFQARYGLAGLLQARHDYPEAKRFYLEVVEQQPAFVDALANLSSILESEHQLDEAQSYANRALGIKPDHYIARLTLANIAIRNESYDEAVGLLLPVVESQKLSPVNHAVAGGKCAYAYEKLGDYQSAYSFYEACNQTLYRAFEARVGNPGSLFSLDSIRCIDQKISTFGFSDTSREDKSPVFLIGFPRSGTTLLDQILSSHSRICVLEEKENLLDVYQRYPATEVGLSELNHASEDELSDLRKKYWNKVAHEIGNTPSENIIVDKLPLNAIALLHIYKLFPDAKIVVALRDPRDSVFSCFQQRFGMNEAMFQLLKLDSAVSYYDRVMTVVTKIRDTGVMPMHFVRYEQVIGNFTQEVNSLIDFLGLEWEDGLVEYQATARSRFISTPSASQVIQPLYTSSIGKWKHFEQWIGNSFDPLHKWVEEWGY